MWQPEPGWHPLPGAAGPSTVGVWRTATPERALVVKRLAAPGPLDLPELADPRHFAYWRREADVLAGGLAAGLPGVRGRADGHLAVEEDDEGITLTQEWVEDACTSGLFVAHALGRLAGAPVSQAARAGVPLARDQLRDRLGRVAARGGWTTLARTTVSDVADHLWSRRSTWLARVDALPQVLQHGDPTPANLRGRDGDDVVAVDWGSLGTGPVGSDLGYYSLAAREDLPPLLDAFLLGLPTDLATADEVLLGARVTAVYTALTRADWALGRVATGEGALAGKFRHPSVAPYLRSLQRQSEAVEALIG